MKHAARPHSCLRAATRLLSVSHHNVTTRRRAAQTHRQTHRDSALLSLSKCICAHWDVCVTRNHQLSVCFCLTSNAQAHEPTNQQQQKTSCVVAGAILGAASTAGIMFPKANTMERTIDRTRWGFFSSADNLVLPVLQMRSSSAARHLRHHPLSVTEAPLHFLFVRRVQHLRVKAPGRDPIIGHQRLVKDLGSNQRGDGDSREPLVSELLHSICPFGCSMPPNKNIWIWQKREKEKRKKKNRAHSFQNPNRKQSRGGERRCGCFVSSHKHFACVRAMSWKTDHHVMSCSDVPLPARRANLGISAAAQLLRSAWRHADEHPRVGGCCSIPPSAGAL